MKSNKERLFDFFIDYTHGFSLVEDDMPKLDTQFLSEKLNIQRSNVSTLLNQLVEEGKLEKDNGRPVLYSLNKDIKMKLDNQNFSTLIGSEGSLKEVIQYTKAAITYPMNVPRILYIGNIGTGIETLARKAFDYAVMKKIINSQSKFVKVNCSHYTDEQVRDILLGKDRVINKENLGLLFLKNIQNLSLNVLSEILHELSEVKNKKVLLVLHSLNEIELDSMLREYFNFIIKIPSLKNRGLDERYLFIEKFIQEEAGRIGKRIEVNYGLMQCLMVYPCNENLKELQKNIQFGIANAFIRIKGKENVTLELSDLPSNVRKGLLYIKDHRVDLDRILGRNSRYAFSGEKTYKTLLKTDSPDIYRQLDNNHKILEKSFTSLDLDKFIYANLEDELQDYLNKLTDGLDEEKVNEIVSEKMRVLVKDFINMASIRFNRVYSNTIYWGIALHLNNAIIKSSNKQRVTNQKIMEIMENYDEEYIFSRKFIKTIQKEFNVKFSLDETIFITLFLTMTEKVSSKANEVAILVAMHGEQTASSVVEVVKTLMPNKNLFAFNVALDRDIENSYSQLKKTIININKGKGIYVLYDMGSIQMMIQSIKDETNIEIASLEVPIPLLAMTACKYSEEGQDLDYISQKIYHAYGEHVYMRLQNKDIIIALSSVNENNSDGIKRYLQTLEDYSDYQILSFNISDKQSLINKINEIQIKGKVVGIVGTYNPEIFNIKYIDYSHIPKVHTIRELLAVRSDDFDVLNYLVEQFNIFTYEDLSRLLLPYVSGLEEIFDRKLNEDNRIGLLIHVGCLINRLKNNKGSTLNFNIAETKRKFSNEIIKVKSLSYTLEEYYAVEFSESDIVTIVEIMTNTRRKNEL